METELERLERLDIIEKVEGPTPWTSPIVVVPKSDGEVRICVDMREPNQAIKRTKHPMPTLDDLISDLNGSTVFSKLDLQVPVTNWKWKKKADKSQHSQRMWD